MAWKKADPGSLPGDFKAYYVYYRKLSVEPPDWSIVSVKDTSVTLIDLAPGTFYGIRLLIAITFGNGISTKEMKIQTIDGG